METKFTDKQIERATKKLANALAFANYPHERTEEEQRRLLWESWREAMKLVRKLGGDKFYHDAMAWYSKHDN